MAFYTETQRKVQAQFDTQALADRVEKAIVSDELDEKHSGFIASRDYFFLSTVNSDGEPTVSYKGGNVGTVTIIDSKTVAFPAYDGNGMFLSVGNVVDTAKIGMLFMDFETPNRIRLQGTATLTTDDPLMDKYPGAYGIIRAHVDKVFLNCARYIHRHQRVEKLNKYVPDAEGKQPFPAWKRIDKIQDVLPADDQKSAQAAGGTITEEEYGAKLMAGDS